MAQRIKTVQESDLRMLGDLARSIQRVLPVTQADIDAAAALGKGWVVTRVFEVSDPLDNLRGGTQLVIRQNSILPGQSVQRVLIVSGPGGQTVVIRGTDYIVLPDAIADSLSYVKAFGGTEQRNIPQPYTQVNYVTNTAQTTVNTGIMIDFAKNYEFEVECRATTGSWYILQSRASSSGNITGISGANSGSTITLVVGNVTACTSAITRTVGHKLYVKATLNAGTATLYVKDETANTEDTKTGSYGTTQPNPTVAMYLFGNAGGQYVGINSDIYMARIKENDTVVMDYVPARQVATAGFYDKASGTFKTGFTPANLSADGNTVPTPDAPMDIVSNNGVLRIQGSATGTVTQTGNPTPTTPVAPEFYQNHGLLLRAIGTDADTYDESTQTITRNIGYKIFDGTEAFGTSNAYGKALYINGAGSTWGANRNKDVLCQYFLGASSPSSGMPEFSCFFNASGHFYFRTNETATDFKAWLAELYANGTPLIVWFVTSTPATESFTPSVYADGTVEIIKLHGKNLFDKNSEYIAGYVGGNDGKIYAAGEVSQQRSFVIPCKPNTTYTLSGMTALSAWGSFTSYEIGNTTTTFVSGNGTLTTGPNDKYLVGMAYTGNGAYDYRDTLQIEFGSTATTYVPYYDGGTATAEMLLKVGDYQDVQSIIDGAVTRNVGVRVLDGTENWSVAHAATYTYTTNISNAAGQSSWSNLGGLCSHLSWYVSGTTPGYINTNPNTLWLNAIRDLRVKTNSNFATLTDWTNYLAAQYAAGTPVIIVYPLATPTTESVTGQTLQVTDGDNVLEITQASLTGLELEVEYQAAVSLTIQEVQDANLDPNVQVTIS